MPSYDPARNCHVVRIVYDGPGMAGKTTNLKRICDVIPSSRRSEMYTPAELKGRTMFFDWLEIDGPSQGGQALKFQLITVPGQVERAYRRKPLIEMADVVAFVCDSSPSQIPDTMRTFARLRALMRRRKDKLPLVVQANKQDVTDAMAPDKLRKRLKLAETVPVIPATAASGGGVKETLMTAIRVGVHTMREGGVITRLAQEFANADALFDHVLTFEDKPDTEKIVDAEELHIAAEDVDVDTEAAAAQLKAASLDDLEARARRAAQRNATRSSGK
ncbi:MAG TPA: GTPase domain-containing protein [Polyangiaceae bacterium]|jgi:signal recognition particle receptor subunit beta|nr:GTPase domain-containing protein [Polyangiaceae bacterium]